MTESILRALSMAFAMGWEILWPLILGFALSAVVQAVVSHREMARLLPDDRPRFDCDRSRSRGGVVIMFLCSRGARPRAVPQGRQFHRSVCLLSVTIAVNRSPSTSQDPL